MKTMVHWISDNGVHRVSGIFFLMLYSVHFFVNILPTSPASLSFSVAVKCNFWDIQSSEFIFYRAVPILFDNIASRLPSTTEDTVREDKRLHLHYSTA